jgi:hypothetical protein
MDLYISNISAKCSSDGIATYYGPMRTGVGFPAEARDFSLIYSFHYGSGANTASYP